MLVLDREGMRLLLVVNPKARNGSRSLDEALEVFERAGIEVVQERGKPVSDALIRGVGPIDAIVVAGGDGTIHDAAPALVRAGLPVGVLPCGTANDLARALRLPLEVRAAALVIAEGATRSIDVGDVNGELFFNVAHVGLGAELADELHGDLKRRFGAFAYGVAAMKTVRRLRPFRATVCIDGETFELYTLGITVGNGRYFGGAGLVSHDAEIDDGKLRLFALETANPLRLVGILGRLLVGRHDKSPKVRARWGRNIEIRTRRPMRIRTDGQVVGVTPARFTVHIDALRCFAPAEENADPSGAP